MINTYIRNFQSKFNATPHTYRIPGRINLIGEHIDYNAGWVLPAAVDKSIYLSIAPSQEEHSHIYAQDFEQALELDHSQLQNHKGWGKYIAAILQIAQAKQLTVQPFNALFGGDLPIGSGMSSSAALCCGFIQALNDLNQWNLSKREIAKMGQATEHQVGIKCGLMDQYAVMFGQKDQFVLLDCLTETHEYVPANLGDYQLVLINSNVKHELLDSEYNNRREACENTLATLQQKYPQVQSFRDITKSMILENEDKFPQSQVLNSLFVVKEIERIQAAVQALKEGKVEELGQLLYDTHLGLSVEYRVSCDELDCLVELAKGQGVIGARMMGGGFGGCTLNLIHKDQAMETAETIAQAYQKETNIEADIIAVKIAQGTHKVE